MGKPHRVNRDDFDIKSKSIPAEVKHLSKRRNRKQSVVRRNIPQVAASEKGRAQTC